MGVNTNSSENSSVLSELADLIRMSWRATLEALGTTGLSVVLWSIIVPSAIWLGIVFWHWFPDRATVSLGAVMKVSLGEGLLACGITLAAWLALLGFFFLRTVAKDRIALREQIRSLTAADIGSVILEGLEPHIFVETKHAQGLQLGISLRSNNDKLISYHVDDFTITPEPNYVDQFANRGGYIYPHNTTVFRCPKIDLSGVDDLEHKKIIGKLHYKITYNVVGTQAIHHAEKELSFEYYPQSSYVQYTLISEHED